MAEKSKEYLAKIARRGGPRKCKRCKLTFQKEAGTLDQICPDCKSRCVRCNVLLTEENHYKELTKRIKFYKCKKCVVETTKLTADPDRKKKYAREYKLLKTYGITLTEYEQILVSQDGKCWICKRPAGDSNLHVDHRHVKKDKKQNPRDTRARVRGLLCWRCNTSLAKFKDNPELMRRAAEYVETCPAQRVLGKDQDEVQALQ